MLINRSVSWLYIFVLAIATCQEETDKQIDTTCKRFENSTCVSVFQCQFVQNLILNEKSDMARVRLCGWQRDENQQNTPKVCCPIGLNTPKENPIIFMNETEPTATQRPEIEVPLKIHNNTNTSTLDTQKSGKVNTTVHSEPFPDRSVCGPVKNDDRIIGGEVTGIDEFPWLVQIKFISPNSRKEYFGCAGSLITDRHVLTAAHCVKRNKVANIRLGEYNVNTEEDCVENDCNDKPIDVAIREIIIHPKYDDADITRYDIAILKLEHLVNFTDFIQPVCLPTSEYVALQDYSRESKYTTAGWGSTEFDTKSPVKRKIELNAVPIDTCRVAFSYINVTLTSPNKVICAGGRKNEDSCQGDSGGALVRVVSEDYKHNWYIYGVTSFGARHCGEEGVPGAYTRVTSYLDWIRETVSRT